MSDECQGWPPKRDRKRPGGIALISVFLLISVLLLLVVTLVSLVHTDSFQSKSQLDDLAALYAAEEGVASSLSTVSTFINEIRVMGDVIVLVGTAENAASEHSGLSTAYMRQVIYIYSSFVLAQILLFLINGWPAAWFE